MIGDHGGEIYKANQTFLSREMCSKVDDYPQIFVISCQGVSITIIALQITKIVIIYIYFFLTFLTIKLTLELVNSVILCSEIFDIDFRLKKS